VDANIAQGHSLACVSEAITPKNNTCQGRPAGNFGVSSQNFAGRQRMVPRVLGAGVRFGQNLRVSGGAQQVECVAWQH